MLCFFKVRVPQGSKVRFSLAPRILSLEFLVDFASSFLSPTLASAFTLRSLPSSSLQVSRLQLVIGRTLLVLVILLLSVHMSTLLLKKINIFLNISKQAFFDFIISLFNSILLILQLAFWQIFLQFLVPFDTHQTGNNLKLLDSY